LTITPIQQQLHWLPVRDGQTECYINIARQCAECLRAIKIVYVSMAADIVLNKKVFFVVSFSCTVCLFADWEHTWRLAIVGSQCSVL